MSLEIRPNFLKFAYHNDDLKKVIGLFLDFWGNYKLCHGVDYFQSTSNFPLKFVIDYLTDLRISFPNIKSKLVLGFGFLT